MAVGTVTYSPGISNASVSGTLTCDASPSATYIDCGFVPSRFLIVNATDKDTSLLWTSGMADASGITDAGVAVTSGGITPIAQTDGTHHGVLVGTDASCQEASKVFNWTAFR